MRNHKREMTNEEFGAIETPSWELVSEALQKPLGEANEEETEAVQFFYEVVLSRITTGDLKDGRAKKRGETYFKALGVKWALTMASGLVLMAHHGDLTNVRANLNVTVLDLTGANSEDEENGSGNEARGRKRKGSETANEQGSGGEPDSSRKRARMHTADTEIEMTTMHYKLLEKFTDLKAEKEEELQETLATWDAKFNPACAGKKQNGLSVVTPTSHQRTDTPSDMDREGRNAFQQLLRRMGMIVTETPVIVDNNPVPGEIIGV